MKLLISLAMSSIALISYGQNSDFDQTFEQQIEHLFEYVNLSDRPHDALWDVGIPLVDLNLFDGQLHDDVVASSALFGMGYGTAISLEKQFPRFFLHAFA